MVTSSHPDIPASLRLPFEPRANPQAVVSAAHVRFTLFTSRLLRLEHSPEDEFEDRPSQAFWYRQQPTPEFELRQENGILEIETEHLLLRYTGQGAPFDKTTLSIQVKEMGADGKAGLWRFGQYDSGNLRGAARTLDGANGRVRLEMGLMSHSGFAAVDDSKSLVFNDQGWLEPRQHLTNQDLYFFGYAHDYTACLQDYCKLTGGVPLIPRWALGNWWSRYWPYSQQELQDLMLDFERHEIPLSVCIIDMDWHIVQQGEHSHWTGYTWNRALWPDPPSFMTWLHQKNLRTALNLHPADGVQSHEEQYPAMARWMGLDEPALASHQGIPFDCADPHFMRGYFEILHHPQEVQGVDFWWLDWQQGQTSKLPGLDPLWWLNHLHFFDLGREGSKRPFIFSRWGGLGNHRYPIGFSGDTVVSWESLAFQPYFTAVSANVGYGWWSHDIGGHMGGLEDNELFARWVQYGVFSPIFRLHSTQNAYQDRRPWTLDAETFQVVRSAMQFRRQLIPYLYSMAWRNYTTSLPPITPMYYPYPEEAEAYRCPDQYFFGSELIAAPYTVPRHPETRLSKQAIWLPPGEWFHFFSGERFTSMQQGGCWMVRCGGLEDMPLFARAGAIIPLDARQTPNGAALPDSLVVYAFAGAPGHFELFEDDGDSSAFQRGHFSLLTFEQKWLENHLEFNLYPSRLTPGAHGHLPEQRTLQLRFVGIHQPDQMTITQNGEVMPVLSTYDAGSETLVIDGLRLSPFDELTVSLSAKDSLRSGRDRRPETLRQYLRSFRLDNDLKAQIDADLEALLDNPLHLRRYAAQLSEAQFGTLTTLLF